MRGFLALAFGLLLLAPVQGHAEEKQVLGVMTTMPILWGEAGDIGELLNGDASAHWAKPVLQSLYDLRALDVLDEASLAGSRNLLIAQPRILAPSENVALDNWVRGGGRLLLLADPMMTGQSRFGFGDPRRPQDVVLISPILARWGLQLVFDESQQPGARGIRFGPSAQLRVDLPGRFIKESGSCRLLAEDIIADCPVGAGHAVIVADAALLDIGAGDEADQAALLALLGEAFG